LFVDLYAGLICYILPNEKRFYAVDIFEALEEAKSNNSTLVLPAYFTFSDHPQLKSMKLKSLVEFKIGHYGNQMGKKTVKAVFLTHNKLFFFPFQMDRLSISPVMTDKKQVIHFREFDL